jgi:IS1 family transposase
MSKKYYFISYAWRRKGDTSYNFENGVRDIHPFDDLLEWKQKYPEEFKLLYFTEITKEQYDKLNGNIE